MNMYSTRQVSLYNNKIFWNGSRIVLCSWCLDQKYFKLNFCLSTSPWYALHYETIQILMVAQPSREGCLVISTRHYPHKKVLLSHLLLNAQHCPVKNLSPNTYRRVPVSELDLLPPIEPDYHIGSNEIKVKYVNWIM